MSLEYEIQRTEPIMPSWLKKTAFYLATAMAVTCLETNLQTFYQTLGQLHKSIDKERFEQQFYADCLPQYGGKFYYTLTKPGREMAYWMLDKDNI